MNGTNKPKTERKEKKKMTGLIITLVVVAILFGVGAVFCAPWSPVHKAMEANRPQSTASADLPGEGRQG